MKYAWDTLRGLLIKNAGQVSSQLSTNYALMYSRPYLDDPRDEVVHVAAPSFNYPVLFGWVGLWFKFRPCLIILGF